MFSKLSLGVATALTALTSVAQACPHSQEQFICPGDPVVDSSGNKASVIGVNAYQQAASIRYDNTYYGSAVIPFRQLALGLGCVGSACVGDRAADSSGNTARITGLNPYNFTAAISYDNTYYGNAVIAMSQLYLGMGCLDNYCVNDPVSDSSGNTATITGINPIQRRISISYTNTYYGKATQPIDQIELGLGCAMGNCVGDKGSDSSGNAGKVIGVNPFNGKIALAYDNAYYGHAVIDATAFMSSEYCATYGDYARRVQSYVEPHGDRVTIVVYSSGDFRFSTDRRNW